MARVLVVDDDTRLRNLIGKFLEENNFEVLLAKDAAEAEETISKNAEIDIIILDVMMPNEDGISFTARFRAKSQTPIIMLTARGEFEDRIKGLEVGADDYLSKPFEPKELLLRINNVLRRSSQKSSNNNKEVEVIKFGDFIFNIKELRLKKAEQFIHLTDSEAKILKILCLAEGKIMSREKLSTMCGDIDERSVDVQITRLRRKIEQNPKQPHYLQTARNQGYVLYN